MRQFAEVYAGTSVEMIEKSYANSLLVTVPGEY